MLSPPFLAAARNLLGDVSTHIFIGFIALTTALFLVLLGLGAAQRGDVFAVDDRILIVSNAVAPRYLLPVRYAGEIGGGVIPGVAAVVAVNYVPATLAGGRQRLAVVAADPANFLAANTDVLVGRSLGRGWVDDRTGVLVGRDLAMRLGFKVGDDIAIDSPSFRAAGASGPVRFVVSALYDVRDQAYPSYGVVIHEQLIRPNGQENVSQGANAIMVLLKSRDQASLVSQFIDTSYRASPVPTRTTLREEFVESFSQQGAGLTSLLRLYGLGGLASAALLLGTFFYYASRRLERSISVLRLLGFGRRRILLAVAAAMSLSAGAGAAIGVALTFICLAMFKVAIEQAFTAFSVRLVDGLVAVPVAAFAAFLASALIMVLLLRNPAGISTADGDWA